MGREERNDVGLDLVIVKVSIVSSTIGVDDLKGKAICSKEEPGEESVKGNLFEFFFCIFVRGYKGHFT